MRKFIAALIILCALVGIGGYLVYLNAPSLLANMISRKTKVAVSVDSIDFRKGQFTINKLHMANPKEAKMPTALSVETINVQTPYKNYLHNPIVIDKIHVDNVYVNIQIYNKDQTKGNWQTMIGNFQEDHTSAFSIERSAFIKKLLFTNIRIDLILADGSLYKLSPIKKIEFDNIESEKGIPTEEISEIIVQKMMESIFLQKGLKTIIQTPQKIIKKVIPFL